MKKVIIVEHRAEHCKSPWVLYAVFSTQCKADKFFHAKQREGDHIAEKWPPTNSTWDSEWRQRPDKVLVDPDE